MLEQKIKDMINEFETDNNTIHDILSGIILRHNMQETERSLLETMKMNNHVIRYLKQLLEK